MSSWMRSVPPSRTAKRPVPSSAERSCWRSVSEDSAISGFPASAASLIASVPIARARPDDDGLQAVAAMASAARLFARCIGRVSAPMLRARALAVKKGPASGGRTPGSAPPRPRAVHPPAPPRGVRRPHAPRPAPPRKLPRGAVWSMRPQSVRAAERSAACPQAVPRLARRRWSRAGDPRVRGGGALRAALLPRRPGRQVPAGQPREQSAPPPWALARRRAAVPPRSRALPTQLPPAPRGPGPRARGGRRALPAGAKGWRRRPRRYPAPRRCGASRPRGRRSSLLGRLRRLLARPAHAPPRLADALERARVQLRYPAPQRANHGAANFRAELRRPHRPCAPVRRPHLLQQRGSGRKLDQGHAVAVDDERGLAPRLGPSAVV